MYRNLQYAKDKSPGTVFGRHRDIMSEGSNCNTNEDGTSWGGAFYHVSKGCIIFLTRSTHPASRKTKPMTNTFTASLFSGHQL